LPVGKIVFEEGCVLGVEVPLPSGPALAVAVAPVADPTDAAVAVARTGGVGLPVAGLCAGLQPVEIIKMISRGMGRINFLTLNIEQPP
jgi:hypothetical protein